MARKTKEELERLREHAKLLFIREGLTAKEISARIDVSEITLSKWRNEDNWDKLKVTLTQTREEQLRSMYEQLAALNDHISKKDGKFPDSKEADALAKLTRAIRDLERETNVAEMMDSFMQFMQYLRSTDEYLFAKTLAPKFDAFIKSKL